MKESKQKILEETNYGRRWKLKRKKNISIFGEGGEDTFLEQK